jgi:hypothetical protein
METKPLKLTKEEADFIIGCIDIAVRQRGLVIARASTVLHEKILNLFSEQTPVIPIKEEVEKEK